MKNKITIISRPKFQTEITPWRKREDIPNQENFAVLVLLSSGLEAKTKVIKDSTGCHCLEGIAISSVSGWVPLPPDLANIKPE
jgi:hypothetical protein